MACGTAVVATAVGGIPEVVVDGVTGTLVRYEQLPDGTGEPADAGALARDLATAITELLADPARADRMGAAGRERVVTSFSWRAIAERTAALYGRLLGTSGAGIPV
jgi:starch synthase